MKKITILFCLCVLIIFSGCAKETKKNDRPDWIDNPKNNRPDWIDNPEPNFVGRCATHIKGFNAQEECAYKKGLAYIAMSKGVSVDISSEMTMKQTATEKTGSSYGEAKTSVKIDENNIKVSGTIIDKWHDKSGDIMYVLIKEN